MGKTMDCFQGRDQTQDLNFRTIDIEDKGSLSLWTVYGQTNLIAGTSLIGNFHDQELELKLKLNLFFDILLNKASALLMYNAFMIESRCDLDCNQTDAYV